MKKLLAALVAGAFVMAQAPAVFAQATTTAPKAAEADKAAKDAKPAADKAAKDAKPAADKAAKDAKPADAKAAAKPADAKADEGKKKKGGC